VIRPLLQTLRLLGVSMLAGASWVAFRPAELPKAAAPSTAKADDLLDHLRQTAIKRSAVIEVSEADINRHLGATLAGKIPGRLGGWAAFEGARVDLESGNARLFLIWNVKGFTRTASLDFAISRADKEFHVEVLRGAYGHLQMPRGMMRLLYPSLEALAKALDPEIRALFQMNQITIAKGKLVLDPRFPHE